MEKGLRCPNCDTTINRKVVHDWIANKTAPFLDCANQFCNVRWRRSVLEANAALFSGKAAPKPNPKPAPKAKPVEVSAPKVVKPKSAMAVATPKADIKRNKKAWLRRVRRVAETHAKKHGVVSVDVLRRWADENDDHPDSPSAWGSVFQTDKWTKVSEMASTRKAARSRKVSVWSLTAATPVAVSA